MKEFSKLCTPAKLYFAIAVLSSIGDLYYGYTIMSVVWKLLFAFVWTYLLSLMCDKHWSKLAWFLVLLPYILLILAALNIFHLSFEHRQWMRYVGFQGAYGQEPFSALNPAKF